MMNTEDDTDIKSVVKSQRSYVTRDVIVMLVIIIGVTVWSFASGDNEVGIQLGNDSVTVTIPDDDKTKFTMDFSDIVSLELVNVPDFGICISGGENRNTRYGIWENDSWTNYELYADTSFNECIVMQSADTILVFNTESSEITAELYSQIKDDLL